jgi:hypothetical protein
MPYITSFERYGIAKGLREGIAAALEVKFGKADKRFMSRVLKIHDVEALRDLLKAIPAAETLQELRDWLPARQE